MTTDGGTVGAVVAAAGSGTRLDAGVPKALVEVAGRALVVHAVTALGTAGISTIVVVHPPGEAEAFARALSGLEVTLAAGGASRTASVMAGLEALPQEVTVVAVHDAARGLTPPSVIRRTVAAVDEEVVAAAPGVPVADALKRVDGDHRVTDTVDRRGVWGVQTPQVFLRTVLERAHRHLDGPVPDDLAAVEAALAAGVVEGEVAVVRGGPEGRKVTWPQDLRVAEAFAGAPHPGAARIGSGLDAHAFDPTRDRPLVLAGVEIPGAPGLAGHSDGDVVCHAVTDALLGAAGEGDLGERFGVDDPELADARSLELLAGVVSDLGQRGIIVRNADVTVVAERPRLLAHRDAMITALTDVLGTPAVSVKMTTTDGLGALGRGEGIACWATCLADDHRRRRGRQ